jgi:GAF domain-containing protein
MDQDVLDSFFYALVRVVDAIYQDEPLSDTLYFICSLCTELTGAKGSTIRVLEQGTFQLKVLSSCGLSHEYLNSGAIDYGRSVTEIEHGEIIIINNFETDPRVQNLAAAKKEGVKAVIGIPFTVNETTFSILRVYFSEKKRPTQEEIEVLTGLGQLSCLAIERAAVAVTKNNQRHKN